MKDENQIVEEILQKVGLEHLDTTTPKNRYIAQLRNLKASKKEISKVQ